MTAREKINNATRNYSQCMSYLIMEMTGELLKKEKSDHMKNALQWVNPGNEMQRHRELQRQRTPGTGEWFLHSTEGWMTNTSTASLICHGMGKSPPGKLLII